MPPAINPESRRFALRVALLYALLGSVWIVLSDKTVEWLTSDPRQIVLFSAVKGLAFIAVSALALWLVLRRHAGQSPGTTDTEAEDAETGRSASLRLLPPLAAGLAILALTTTGIQHTVQLQEDRELARLHAIAELKARLVVDWLRERQDDAGFIASARHLASAYQRWHARHDEASGELLRGSLREFVQYNGFHGAQVLDSRGERMLWDSEALPGPVPTAVRAAAERAWAERKPIHVGPYRDADNRLHLDFVVALPAAPAAGGPVVVLHVDLLAGLFPTLQTWPGPSRSGEVVWFRRDGGDVLFLNELRHRADTAAKLRLPVTKQTLAGQVLRGAAKLGQAVKGVDYRGMPVFGVVHAVPGTDWFLLAKVDQSELYAEVYRDAAWIILAGLLALFVLGAGTWLARQRRELAIAGRIRQSQAERLRALRLLAAIADSSSDAIFAKDLDDRFILFNRAAQSLTGKTQEEVLGRDETALFPPELASRQLADNRKVMEGNMTLAFQEEIATPEGARVFLTTKGPLHDSEGRVIGLYGIARDITEREQAAAALRREVELNQRYLDTMQTIMVALDGKGRIAMINRKGCELLGYAEDELLGRDWFADCLPQPQGMEVVHPVFRRILAGELEAVEYFENMILARDGRQRLIAWHNAYLRDSAGQIVGTLSSGEDITKRKAAEENLHRQTEELARRNEELERFNRAVVGREIDMIALKRQINELSRELGREPAYPLAFLDRAPAGDGEP